MPYRACAQRECALRPSQRACVRWHRAVFYSPIHCQYDHAALPAAFHPVLLHGSFQFQGAGLGWTGEGGDRSRDRRRGTADETSPQINHFDPSHAFESQSRLTIDLACHRAGQGAGRVGGHDLRLRHIPHHDDRSQLYVRLWREIVCARGRRRGCLSVEHRRDGGVNGHPCIHTYIHTYIHPSVRLSVRPSVRPSVHPSIRPPIHNHSSNSDLHASFLFPDRVFCSFIPLISYSRAHLLTSFFCLFPPTHHHHRSLSPHVTHLSPC
jgi:hypothetical protein